MRNCVAAILLVGTLQAASPALAQEQMSAARTAAEVDPERLITARRLMAIFLPPQQRDAMIDATIEPMMESVRETFYQMPELQRIFEDEPAALPIFDRFVSRQRDHTVEQLRSEWPALEEAMARAYARRFTIDQMVEIEAFLATSTGQAYLAESMTIMSDPDVAAWQTRTMSESLARYPEEMARLMEELRAAGIGDDSGGEN